MEKLKPTIHGQAASSAPSTGDSQRLKSRKSLILKCQRIIFSAYRTDQYSDPDGYLTSLGLVLEQYPNDVIVYVTDPRTGVQRGCKWPPTIAEIVEACDKRMQDQAKLERYRNWGKPDAAPAIEAPREERPTLEEMKEKYGEEWGLTPDPRPKPGFKTGQAPSWQEIVTMYHRDPERLARLMRIADKYADDRGDAPA
jgi:hypothetical protein